MREFSVAAEISSTRIVLKIAISVRKSVRNYEQKRGLEKLE